MKNKVILFFSGFFIWCVLNWVPDAQHLIVGVFAAALVAVIIGDLFVRKAASIRHPHRYWYFVSRYVPRFLWECLKSNIDVAYRVIHPKLPIKPGIVKVKTTLKSDTALTFLANSITLTPGTMSVDIDTDNGFLYVHCLYVEETDIEGATKKIVTKFENILAKIFD